MGNQPADAFRPTFIVGCARSGTTLLATLMDRHPLVCVPPETNMTAIAWMNDAAALGGKGHDGFRPVLNENPFSDLRLDADAVIERFRGYPTDFRHFFQASFEEYAASHGKTIVVEKTPDHLFEVRSIIRWYPHAKFIGIVRDGRDVAQSLVNVSFASDDLATNALRWRRAAALGRRLEKEHADRWHPIRFEDLVRDPERELTAIANFLGIDFEPCQIDPTVPSSTFRDRESWKAQAKQAIDPGKLEVWRKFPAERHRLLDAIQRPALRRHGYPETDPAGWPSCHPRYLAVQGWLAWNEISQRLPELRPSRIGFFRRRFAARQAAQQASPG